jgi:Zn-dependent peptidase ImmA (M78 family)
MWAREVRGMPQDIAAGKLGVSVERLAAFEAGVRQPTVGQLRTIGRVYRKPTAFFYLADLPDRPEKPRDFRRLPDVDDGLSPELRDAISRSQQRRADALELQRLLDQRPAALDVAGTLEDKPRELAKRIRQRTGVALAEQLTWREQYAALRNWTDAVEECGILVSQFSDVDVSEARGFSIGEHPLPVVALNGKDSPRAKIFTLLHELAHLALGAAGLCDLHESGNDVQSRVETYCNEVAAEVLVPQDALLQQDIVVSHDGQDWSDDDLRELATRFSVSQEVVLRRLLTLGRTSPAFYRRKREEYHRRLESAEPAGGFMPYFRRVLRDNGPAFTAMALEAYHATAITSLELSRVLGGIKLRHVDNIQHALSRGRE